MTGSAISPSPLPDVASAEGPPAPELDVTVVLPCLNEEGAVGGCVTQARAWLARSGLRGEVVVVDNGSADASAAEATAAGARVLRESRRGKGNACLAGFAAARGSIVVLSDADGTYDLGNLDALLAPLDNGGCAMVIGDRRESMHPGSMSWLHRRVGNPLISLLARVLTGLPVHDALSGLRAVRREALQEMNLRTRQFEIEVEMIMRAGRLGLPMREVPVSYAPRTGSSKLRSLRDGWAIVRFLLLYTPELVLMVPGLLLAIAGLAALGFTLAPGAGLSLGTLNWRPVFLGPALLTVGTNALLLGLISNLYTANRGLAPPGLAVRLYRRYGSFERLLQTAAALVLAGVIIDAVLLVRWLAGAGNDVHVAAAAQAAIMAGANAGLGGFVAALIEDDSAV